MTAVFVDADGCPVKDETYRVAKRHALVVHVVANAWISTPSDPNVRLEKVSGGFDAADDWIAERAGPGDIVVTCDILLAARCLKKGAAVVGTTGRPFTARDRSHFLQALDQAIQAGRRRR